MKKIICIIIIIMIVVTGCGKTRDVGNEPGEVDINQEESGVVDETEAVNEQVGTVQDGGDEVDINQSTAAENDGNKTEAEAVWVVYWDDEDYVSKLSSGPYDPEIICEFEAYFDGKHNLVKEERMTEQYRTLKALPGMSDKKIYLTFVNDVVSDGKSSQKDTKVLYDVLKDPEKHASDIVRAAKEEGFDGIEIDYEKIRDDLKLWKLFISFENELIKAAGSEGIPLRIVLEPSTPVEKIDLPRGPEYVVMCYNLYGYGTKPGPKADRDFLVELAERFEPLSDNLGFAFANGGFDWNLSKDTIEPLTDLQGKQLIKDFGKDAKRDEKSFDITFTYEKDGLKHEVYFADDETIKQWADIIYENTHKKVRINIWRI